MIKTRISYDEASGLPAYESTTYNADGTVTRHGSGPIHTAGDLWRLMQEADRVEVDTDVRLASVRDFVSGYGVEPLTD